MHDELMTYLRLSLWMAGKLGIVSRRIKAKLESLHTLTESIS